MAFIYRDTLMPAVGQYNAFSRVFQLFNKTWPKTSEVYGTGLIFYAYDTWTDAYNIKRFATSIGIDWDEFLAQDVDNEIAYMYFKLNPIYEWDGSYAGDSRVKSKERSTRATTQLVAPTAEEISDYFNETFEVGDIVKVTVEYGSSNRRYINQHNLTWNISNTGSIESQGLSTSAIRNELESNPWYYLANSRQVPYTKNSNKFQLYDGGSITDYKPVDSQNPDGEISSDPIPGTVGNMPGRDQANKPSNRLLGTTQTYVTVEGYELPTGGAEEPMYNLGVFAKMSNGVVFERTEDPMEQSTGTRTAQGLDGEVVKYSYTMNYKFNGCDPRSDLVQQIVDWYEHRSVLKLNRRPVYTDVGTYKDNITYHTKDNIFKKTLDQMLLYQDPNTGRATRKVTNSLFLNGLLRTEPARLMRRSDFAEMIGTCLDVDYVVEKASWFEKAAAVLIVILAVVAAFFTAGGSLVALASMGATTLASALGAATLVLSVGMYALAMFGGLSAQHLVQIIGRIAQWVGYLATVIGIYAFIHKAGQIAAQQIVKEAGIDVTTEAGTLAVKDQMLKQTFLDNVGSAITQSLESITTKLTEFVTFQSFDISAVSEALKGINMGLDLYMDKEKQELEELQDELTELEDKYNQETLNNMTKSPAAVYLLVEDRLASYDAISEMDRMMQGKTGADSNYATWYSNVNSV